MRVGVLILPALPWRRAQRLWRLGEELGFDTAWTYDHLAWRELRDGPWYSALPVLTAAATVTRRIRLGTLVASPNYRHPVTFAKEAMTVDDVSGGRLTLGMGAGAASYDAVMLGQEPLSDADRAARFEEFVAHLDALLREPATPRLDGRFYAARDARAIPGCVQRPRVPFAIAAAGPRGQRLAARLGDSWITLGHPRWPDDLTPAEREDVLRRQVASLDRACEAAGRDPATLERIYMTVPNREPWWGSPEAFREQEARLAALGFAEVVIHYPHPGTAFALDGEERFCEVMAEVLAPRRELRDGQGDRARAHRLAENESLFRAVNERLEHVAGADRTAAFLCECADVDCTQRIAVSHAAYEAVRADSVTFLIVPGHEIAGIEDVVRYGDGYAVVRKRGAAAAAAEELDPRA